MTIKIDLSSEADKNEDYFLYPKRTYDGFWASSIGKCQGLQLQARITDIAGKKMYFTRQDKRYHFSTSFYWHPEEVIEMKLMDKLDRLFKDENIS